MDNCFDKYLLECTRGLSGDPGLRQQVIQELGGHLEEHIAAGLSHADALKRMGDAEDVGRELTAANQWRLGKRANLRRLLWCLLGASLIAGVVLCVDWRLIEWYALRESLFSKPSTAGVQGLASRFDAPLRVDADEDDRLLAKVYRGVMRADHAALCTTFAELCARNPQDKCYASARLVAVLATPRAWRLEHTEEVSAALAAGRAADPENALYDYAEAWWIGSKEGLWGRRDVTFPRELDPARRSEKAARLYAGCRPEAWSDMSRLVRAGLSKELRYDRAEFLRRLAQAMPPAKGELAGIFQEYRLTMANNQPCLSILLRIGQWMRVEAARPGADAAWGQEWRRFLPQILRSHGGDDLALLCFRSHAEEELLAAKARGDEQSMKELSRIIKAEHDFRLKRMCNLWAYKRGLLPFFPHGGEYADEAVRPECELNLLVLDKGALALFYTGGIVWMLCLALHFLLMWLRGMGEPFLVVMPWRNWLRLALYGTLPPLLVYLLWNELDLLHGRAAVKFDPWTLGTILRYLLGCCWLWVAPPLWFGWVRRRELKRAATQEGFPDGRLPATSRALHALVCTAFLLAATGLALFPLQRSSERRLAQQYAESLGNPDFPGTPRQETEFVRMAAERALKAFSTTNEQRSENHD